MTYKLYVKDAKWQPLATFQYMEHALVLAQHIDKDHGNTTPNIKIEVKKRIVWRNY